MLSSTPGEEARTTRSSLNTVSSTSSKSSSSTCSSSSPFPTHQPRNMEEVWQDINLSSLHDHSSSANPRNPDFILQDFLARPTTKHLPTAAATPSVLFGSSLWGPGTVLSLNSGLGFDFFESPPGSRLTNNSISTLPSPLEGLASPPSLGSFGKKSVHESDSSSGDRRHKRMIKNRESAARSRARKQAYTNELEREVDILLAENAKLKRQQEELRLAAASHQLPKKHTLHRTSTAPF